MNKRGLTKKDFLNIYITIITLIILYLIYKALKAKIPI